MPDGIPLESVAGGSARAGRRVDKRPGHLATVAAAVLTVLPVPLGSLETASPAFTDVTASAGIDYLQNDPSDSRSPVMPIRMSGGAAAGDYDGDGWADLYVTRLNAPGILFHNRGDGTFEDATVQAGLAGPPLDGNGVGWGDVDNDGDLDLYVTAIADTRFYLFINGGDGRFSEEAVSRGAAVSGADPHSGYSVTFGDYDQDGWLDIHTTEWRLNDDNPSGAPANSRLLHNRGSSAPGHFDDVTVAAGVVLDGLSPRGSFSFASRFVDMDQDGWPDLIVASDFGTSRLFWNNRNGTFTDGTAAAGVGTDENGMGSAVGDYDGDGRPDWFVTSIFDPARTCDTQACNWGFTGNRLYHNEGNRTFSDQTDAKGVRDGFWGWGAAFLDFDNDSDLDIVMTNGVNFPGAPADQYVADPMRLWRNDGPGIMSEISAAAGLVDTGSGKGLLTFDYDNDGDLDIFVVNCMAHPKLYRNDVGNGSGWLRVRTVGFMNRFGIGAKVMVTPTPGGATYGKEIEAGSHFLGQSELTAHFGLGGGTEAVDEVRVRWPGTFTLQVLRNVPRNSTLVVQEPIPPVRLKIDGLHPDSRAVTTSGPFTVSYDTVTGPFASPLDWYFFVIANGQLLWITPDGFSTVPRPLAEDLPVPTGSHPWGTFTLPPGAQVTFGTVIGDGQTVVGIDYLTARATTATAR